MQPDKHSHEPSLTPAKVLFDRGSLDKLESQVGPETVVEIIQSFLQSLQTAGTEIQEHGKTLNWKQVGFTAHRLRSSCALLGCYSLEALCLELETLCNEPSPHSSDDIEKCVETFLEEQILIRGEFQDFLSNF